MLRSAFGGDWRPARARGYRRVPQSVLICVVIVFALASSASAGTRTIHFDGAFGPSTGSVVTGAYRSQGVVFGDGPHGQRGFLPKLMASSRAHSPPRVLGDFVKCSLCPLVDQWFVELWGQFTRYPQRKLNFHIGRLGTAQPDVNDPLGLEISLYDVDGNHLATTARSLSDAPGLDHVCVSYEPGGCGDPFGNPTNTTPEFGKAAYFSIAGTGPSQYYPDVALDTLAVWEPDRTLAGQVTPHFGLARKDSGPEDDVGVRIGGSTPVRLKITRLGDVGPLDLSIEQRPPLRLPGGEGAASITAKFDQNPAYGENVVVTFSAGPGAPRDRVPVEIVARRSNSAIGQREARLRVPVTVVQDYDAEIAGMLVTQAVQPPQALATTSGSRYAGVPLMSDSPTVVRVFPDLVAGPTKGFPVMVSLTAQGADGKPLPGPPAIYGNQDPFVGRLVGAALPRSQVVLSDDVKNITRGFTFALPAEWTEPRSEVTLKAQVYPASGPLADLAVPPSQNPELLKKCETPACVENDTFTLTGISFDKPVFSLYYGAVAMYATDGSGTPQLPPGAEETFKQARALLPGGLATRVRKDGKKAGFTVFDTKYGYDVTEELAGDDAKEELSSLMEDFEDDVVRGPGCCDGFIGIVDGFGLAGAASRTGPSAWVQARRPLTSVAHELSHLIGFPHADTQCGGNSGGQIGTDSTVDGGFGSLQTGSLGLDLSMGWPSYRVVTDPSPVTTKTDSKAPAAALAGNFFDYMSYCASGIESPPAARGDPDSWISPQNFTTLEQGFAGKVSFGVFPRTDIAPSTAALRAGAAPPNLRVSGYRTADGRAEITHVRRSAAPMRAPEPDSPYRLVVHDAQGGQLATAPMAVRRWHVDGAAGDDLTLFSAELPMSAMATRAAGVPARVDVTFRGVPVASQVRSPNLPRVRLRVPRRGQRIGRGSTFVVVWDARDADGGRLRTKIDFSADDGRTWQPLMSTMAHGRIRLPSRLLQSSRRARIRLRVHDGFNEASAVSRRFVAIGRGPRVRIQSPRRAVRVRDDSPLPLAGQAVDETGNPLSPRRLRWYVGRRLIGRGTFVTAFGLPAGRVRVRLVARGHSGRVGMASVAVRVVGSKPRFVRLARPARLPTQARRLRLRVAASLPSILTVSGRDLRARRVKLGQRPRTVYAAIRSRRRGPLKVTLQLQRGSKRTKVALSIPRR